VRAAVFLPAGALADRLPRKPLLLGAWVIGPIAALLMGLAQTWQGTVPGLLLYGSSAYCIPVINAYLAHTAPSGDVARTFTTVYAIHTLGGIISPAIGGWLAGTAGFRAVYFVAAALFAVSAIPALGLCPQAVPPARPSRRLARPLRDGRVLAFAAVTLFAVSAMYLGFPLTPNFLSEVRDLDVTRIGFLGSLQALGMSGLGLLLGRLRSTRRAWGLALGQGLVWISSLLLLWAGAFPLVGMAYLLRGAYQGCRSLAQAHASRLGVEGERGPILGATETIITAAQVFTTYAAGWLYASGPSLPLQASALLIPVGVLLTLIVVRAP
jgi:predicted MFS family arabinose efflux permease